MQAPLRLPAVDGELEPVPAALAAGATAEGAAAADEVTGEAEAAPLAKVPGAAVAEALDADDAELEPEPMPEPEPAEPDPESEPEEPEPEPDEPEPEPEEPDPELVEPEPELAELEAEAPPAATVACEGGAAEAVASVELPQLGGPKLPSEDFWTDWPGSGYTISLPSSVVQPLETPLRLATKRAGKVVSRSVSFGAGAYRFLDAAVTVAGPQFI